MDVNHDFDHQDMGLGNAETRRNVLNGSFLASSSYDGTCKIWTDGDFKPLKSMTGLEGKVTCCDISGDAKYVATTLYDRTFKLFASHTMTLEQQ
jgi:U4/U6 small nuclear ribonucleoprotein PRP4